MDFSFDDQQIQFRDAVRSFLVVQAAPELLREHWETTDSGRSPELRKKITEQGLTALSVPEAYGGLGQGDLDWVLLLQEVGYHGIPDSLSDAAYIGIGIIAALEDEAFKSEWLGRMCEGKARIAISHPLNPLVHDAQIADLILLWHNDEIHAATPDQVALELNPSIDASRRLYKLDWSPSEATRICDSARGQGIWAQAVNRAAVSVAAQMVGLAQRMLDLGIEFARPVLHRAAYAMQHGDARLEAKTSHARLACAEAALLAARNAMQAHGAMGYTWEADLQMFMKRAWALESFWGDRLFHKQRVAQSLFAEDASIGPGTTF